jgi:hypothetical protein
MSGEQEMTRALSHEGQIRAIMARNTEHTRASIAAALEPLGIVPHDDAWLLHTLNGWVAYEAPVDAVRGFLTRRAP